MNLSEKIVLGVLVLLIIGLNGAFITALSTGISSHFSESTVSPHITADDAKSIALNAVPGEIKEFKLEKEHGAYVYEVEIDTGNENKEVIVDRESGLVLSVVAEEDEAEENGDDVPITGTPLERASEAALAHIGEGRVTDSEIGDEDGYYEIEIRLNNGDEVDVHLDEHFRVLSVEYD